MGELRAIRTGVISIPIKNYPFNLFLERYYSFLKESSQTSEIVDAFYIDKNYIHFPRHTNKLKNLLKDRGWELRINDKTITNKISPDFKTKSLELRDYQKPVVQEIIKTLLKSEDNAGILQAVPSFGKSFIIPTIVEHLGMKTLIIVDRKDLANQMKKEFEMNVENKNTFKILTKDNFDPRVDVFITTFQLLVKNKVLLKTLSDWAGFVVVDECHTIGSRVFTEVLVALKAKYRLGLSATPTRSDGLTEILRDTFSNNIVKGHNPTNINVYMIGVLTGIKAAWEQDNFSQVFTDNMTRPAFVDIVTDILTKLKQSGRVVLIYTNYNDIRTIYKSILTEKGFKVAIIDGKTKKTDREKYLKQIQTGELDFLITGVIIQKGISIHRLDTVVNLGFHNKESMEQLVGRLRREHSDKKVPMFIDFYLEGVLRKNSADRHQIATKLAKLHNDKYIKLTLPQFLYKLNNKEQ